MHMDEKKCIRLKKGTDGETESSSDPGKDPEDP